MNKEVLQVGLKTMKERSRIDKRYKKEKEQLKALCLSAHPGNTIIKRSNRLASSQGNFKQEVTILSEVKINYG